MKECLNKCWTNYDQVRSVLKSRKNLSELKGIEKLKEARDKLSKATYESQYIKEEFKDLPSDFKRDWGTLGPVEIYPSLLVPRKLEG